MLQGSVRAGVQDDSQTTSSQARAAPMAVARVQSRIVSSVARFAMVFSSSVAKAGVDQVAGYTGVEALQTPDPTIVDAVLDELDDLVLVELAVLERDEFVDVGHAVLLTRRW